MPFSRAKILVQCTSAGQLTEPRTNAKLLSLKKEKVADKNVRRSTADIPPKFHEVTSWLNNVKVLMSEVSFALSLYMFFIGNLAQGLILKVSKLLATF